MNDFLASIRNTNLTYGLLQSISLSHPQSVIGKNTAECMLSGVTYGTAAMVEGLVKRIQQELCNDTSVIVTGGNTEAVIDYCDLEIHIEPNLLLVGLVDQYMRHEIVHSIKRSPYEF